MHTFDEGRDWGAEPAEAFAESRIWKHLLYLLVNILAEIGIYLRMKVIIYIYIYIFYSPRVSLFIDKISLVANSVKIYMLDEYIFPRITLWSPAISPYFPPILPIFQCLIRFLSANTPQLFQDQTRPILILFQNYLKLLECVNMWSLCHIYTNKIGLRHYSPLNHPI